MRLWTWPPRDGGEQLGDPVIMNLTEMVDTHAKRLVDFAAGLIFGLHGSIEECYNQVFLSLQRMHRRSTGPSTSAFA
jgi:hypothetical protein